MVLLWIIAALALLIALLCLLVVGVHVQYADGALRVAVRAGLLRLQVLPKPAKPKKEPAPEQAKAAEKKKSEKKKLDLTRQEILDAGRTLWPPLKKALGRTRRGIRVHPLTVSAVIGGKEDAAGAAETYGELHAAVWAVMPLLERVIRIPDPRIHIGLDFDAPGWDVACEAGISARVGTLLGVGFSVLVPAVKWYLRHKKVKPQAEAVPEAA